MKVAVTGASGFIGRNFLLGAPREWEIFGFYLNSPDFLDFLKANSLSNVKPIEIDLTGLEGVKKLREEISSNFDVVLYLAANSDPAVSVENPLFDLNSNVAALINFFSNFNCKRAIYFSSGAVYDGLSGLVSPEDKINPKIPYAISKLAAEQLIKFFQKKGTIGEYLIARFFGAFGPHEAERKIYTKLIKNFYFEGKNEFTVRGDGNSLIDAMYIDDAIAGILKMIESGKGNMVVDLGIGAPITINELVNRTAKALGKENITIKHEGSVPEYIKFHMSPEKFEKEFSFKRQFTLEDGIKRFKEFLSKSQGEGGKARFMPSK